MRNGWKKVRLGDAPIQIIDGDRGKNYPNQNELTTNGYCLFLNAKNVTATGFSFSEQMYISREKDSLLRKGRLIKNDVILTTRGTVGNVAFYNDSIPFEHMRINSGMVLLRADSKRLLPDYLHLLMRSLMVQTQIKTLLSGSAQPQLPISSMVNIVFPFPPLPEQCAIAATLSCLDDKIELNNKINANLEAQAQAIFKSWFVDFEPFQDGEFVDSELGLIPEGWRVGTLGDIARYISEKIPIKHCNFENYISTENMLANKLGIINASSLPNMLLVNRYDEHDILISNIRPYFKKIWLSDRIGGCSNDILVIRAKHEELSGYLYCLLYGDVFFGYATATSKGTKMPRGDKAAIMKYPIALPVDIANVYIQQLGETVMQYQERIAALKRENRTLAALRDTLLPKLMRGEIEVPLAESMI